MKEIPFKIGSEEYLIKQTFRALLYFEELTGEQYKAVDLTDTTGKTETLNTKFKLIYCLLKGANRITFKYSYEEFLDLLDDNQDSVEVFFEYLNNLAQPAQPATKKKVTKKV